MEPMMIKVTEDDKILAQMARKMVAMELQLIETSRQLAEERMKREAAEQLVKEQGKPVSAEAKK